MGFFLTNCAVSRFIKVFIFGALFDELAHPRLIRTARHLCTYKIIKLKKCNSTFDRATYPTLLVQQIQNTQLRLDHINARLIIVKVNHRPNNALLQILVLLQLEHMLVELLLQFLVRVIDAKLLERIHLERLEPVNVQHANEAAGSRARAAQTFVNDIHGVLEQPGVHVLGQGVSRSVRFGLVDWDQDYVADRFDFPCDQPAFQVNDVQLKDVGECVEMGVVVLK